MTLNKYQHIHLYLNFSMFNSDQQHIRTWISFDSLFGTFKVRRVDDMKPGADFIVDECMALWLGADAQIEHVGRPYVSLIC